MDVFTPLPKPERPVVTQLIVPGRGIEPNSAEFPGTVQFDSPYSGDSWDRGHMTGLYTIGNPEVHTVILCGDKTFMMPEADRPKSSEAEEMEREGVRLFDLLPSHTDPRSRTTIGNMAQAALSGVLRPGEVTGLVVQNDHAERTRWAAGLVMPETPFVIIPADNPAREFKQNPSRNDRIADAIYRVAMIGVTPGDIETIMKRDELVQKTVLTIMGGIRKVQQLRRKRSDYTQAV